MLLRQGLTLVAAVAWLPVSAASANAWCVVGVERGDALHMRTGPGFFNPIVADIHPRACGIKVVGPCFIGWCPVSFRGRSGWANASYMVSETQPGPHRFAQRASEPARTRAAPTKVAAVAPKRSTPPAAAAPPEPRPAPVAGPAPRTPEPEPPEQRALSAGSGREVCVQGIAKGDTLKVRAGPTASSDLRYGFLPDTCGVKVTGDCKDGWCPVEYRGYKGWAEENNLR